MMSNSGGYVRAICSSAARGIPKKDRGEGRLVQDHGLEGDAHAAGNSGRQVSILLEQYVKPVSRQLGYEPAPGSFAENILVGGLPDDNLGRGTVLKVGEAVVEITTIGKEDTVGHTYSFEGYSLLAEKGLFGRVLESGSARIGDAVVVLKK